MRHDQGGIELMLFSLYVIVVASFGVFAMSLVAFIIQPDPLRKLLAFNIMGSSVFLVFGAGARRDWLGFSDPVPQAIVITGIVVGISSTAFALALLRRIEEEDEKREGEG
jgi:multicomponent Na+:H+ antiporter subunit C